MLRPKTTYRCHLSLLEWNSDPQRRFSWLSLIIYETPRRYFEPHNIFLTRFRSAIYTCIFTFYEIQNIVTHLILMNSRGTLNDLDHSTAQGFSPDYMASRSQKSKCLKKNKVHYVFLFEFSSDCFTSWGFQSQHVKDSQSNPHKQKYYITLCDFEFIENSNYVQCTKGY